MIGIELNRKSPTPENGAFEVPGERPMYLTINYLAFISFNFIALQIPRKLSKINVLFYIEKLRPLLRPYLLENIYRNIK